jgi:hypothetical protein
MIATIPRSNAADVIVIQTLLRDIASLLLIPVE